MKAKLLGRNDPHRNGVISLIRRRVRAGNINKKEVDAWKVALGDELVDELVLAGQDSKPAPKTEKKE